jgi:hypothetical protein
VSEAAVLVARWLLVMAGFLGPAVVLVWVDRRLRR